MQGFSRRHLLAFALLATVLSGCSTPPKQRQLELQRPDETLVKSHAGRFSIQVIETPAAENPRGSQGRFEWLEYQSAKATRRLLLIIGPFGQSLGGVEQVRTVNGQDFTLSLFDGQGMVLENEAQWQLLASLAGQTLEESSSQRQALQPFMQSIADTLESGQQLKELEMPLAQARLRFRIVLDAQ
jgi:hypothetical protein